jgi:hypothetical protein
MAVTNFSPLLGLALPTTGDLSGTWGTTVNDSITQLLDSAVAGTTVLSVDSDVTLSTTNGAANQARNAIIRWTASNGATTRNITAPAQSKAYLVINAGTGSIVIRGSGPTTGVTLPAGTRALVAWNGSDFVKVASNPAVLTTDVSGTLPVANGGTGVTTSTGTGAVVLSNSPTLVTPALGTPASGTLTNTTGLPIDGGTTGILPVARGGSGTATPALVQGSGVTITGTWPNQTIAATGSGGTITAVTASAPLASTGGTTPNISFTGTLATANGGTGNVNGTVAKLATTNFSVEESGGKLVFKYGATTIASMDSSGNIISAANVTAFGTP